MSIQDLTASLDLKQNLNIYAACKQGDSLNLILTIYDNSVQANLTGYTVRLKAMKSDDIPLIQEHTGVAINNNIVTIAADEQLTTTSGKTLIELQFINKTTGQKKATFNLALMVNPSTLEVDGTISTTTYTLLQELENKLDQAGDFFENIDEAIELNSSLETQNTQATSNIADLTTQNNNATQNISNLETQNNNAEPNISSLTSLNIQAISNIAAMEGFGDVTQLAQDVNAVKTEVENARNGETSLDGRLNKFDTSLSDRMKDILSISRKIANASTTINIKLIGDSITAGYGGTGYDPTSTGGGNFIYGSFYENISGVCWANSLKTYLQTNFNCIVKNYGIGGLLSSDIVSHLSDLVKATDDIVICMIGNNNRKITDGYNILVNDIITIYNYVKNLGKEIIFISSNPCTIAEDNLRLFGMDKVDNGIMKATSSLGIEYISVYKLFVEYIENKGLKFGDLILSDGSHPNDKGYEVMYYLILKKLGFARIKSIDDVSDTGWIILSLLNGVTAFAPYTPQYRKVGKNVFIRGSVSNITNANTTIAILPLGFRPSNNHFYTNFKVGNGINAFYIDPVGNLILGGNINASYINTEYNNINTMFPID